MFGRQLAAGCELKVAGSKTRTTTLLRQEHYGGRGGNKAEGRDSYVMNALSGMLRLKKQRGVIMASVVHPMTRSRIVYPNRALVRHASSRKNLRSPRRLAALCERQRSGSRPRTTGPRSNFRLAIRPGRFPSARAARATARRIGVSVWRSD